MTTILTDHIDQLSTRDLGLAIKGAKVALKKPDDDDDEAEPTPSWRS